MGVLTHSAPPAAEPATVIRGGRALVFRRDRCARWGDLLRQGPAFLLCALWLSQAAEPRVQEQRSSTPLEYKVKAAYLFNFVKYVEWPAGASTSPGDPYLIGVLGEDPFGEVLEKTVVDRVVNKRKVIILRSKQSERLKNCHVVFIAVSEKNRIADILASYRSAPILTVSEMERFIQSGGMIAFAYEKETIRFDVDWDQAEENKLKISSRMLASARRVYSKQRAPRK